MKTLQNTLELNSRLVAYTALAGAAFAAPATTQATVIYSGQVNINIPSTTAGIYLNVVTGVTGTSQPTTPGWDVNPWNTASLDMFSSTGATGNATALGGLAPYVGSGTNYFNLALGTLVSAASTFGGTANNTISATTPLNFNSSNNYIGFRFFNEATSAVNYGWMQISLSATAAGQPRAIVSYAYENSGAGITVGATIPEPSTVALLGTMAAGAVGVRAWRRRKAA